MTYSVVTVYNSGDGHGKGSTSGNGLKCPVRDDNASSLIEILTFERVMFVIKPVFLG